MYRIYYSPVFTRGRGEILNGIRKFDDNNRDNKMTEYPKFQHVNQRGNKINTLISRVDT